MEKILVPGISLCEEKRRKKRAERKFKLNITPPLSDVLMAQNVIHTISYLGNFFLSENSAYKKRVIYFGPTGCGEDFYLITNDEDDGTIIDLIEDMCGFISSADASSLEGANEHTVGFDLEGAKLIMSRYHVTLATGRRQTASN